MNETEKRFEEFIETYLVSEDGGWTKATDAGYCSDESKDMFLDIVTLTDFVKSTQPMAWKRFERPKDATSISMTCSLFLRI